MVRISFHIFIFLILIAMRRSFSHARQVKGMKIVADEKQFVVEGLHKETQPDVNPNAEAVDKIGRKVTTDNITVKKTSKENTRKSEQGKNSKRATMRVHNGAEQNWKEYFMAFSEDYRTAKSHPPRNN
ncbi:hypothetical protein CASFOL_018365 [Castilleja foliolosa]|uniref:Uncharacterized protein n=1 Tax=Castilleja foliolosa TaxID=1961234 RepID=A0ABD3D7G8_9LAMI